MTNSSLTFPAFQRMLQLVSRGFLKVRKMHFLPIVALLVFVCAKISVTVAQQVQKAKLVVLLDGSAQSHSQDNQIVVAVRESITEARRRQYFQGSPDSAFSPSNYGRSRQLSSSTNYRELFDLDLTTVKNVGSLSSISLTGVVCKEVAAGAVAFIGPANVEQRRHVRSLCDQVGVIYIEIYSSSYAQPDDRYLRTQTVMDVTPPSDLYARAIASYIAAAGWTKMHFIFDNHISLDQLEPLMADANVKCTFYEISQPRKPRTKIDTDKKYFATTDDSYLLTVRQLWRQYQSNGIGTMNTAILVAVKNVANFVNAALQHQMITRDYTYLFVDLDTHLFVDSQVSQMSRIGANVSVLQLTQTNQPSAANSGNRNPQTKLTLSTKAALAFDATLLLVKGLAELVTTGNAQEPFHPFGQVSCGNDDGRNQEENVLRSNSWPHGDTLLNMLKTASFDETGWTGSLAMHRTDAKSSELTRRSVDFQLLRMNRAGQARVVQEWKPPSGWRATKKPAQNLNSEDDDYPATATTPAPIQTARIAKVLTVATRLAVPFVVKAPPEKIDKNIRARDKSSVVYQGYVVDLVNALAERENFQYRFVIAPGNTPGAPMDGVVADGKNSTAWSGMIGMLLRGEADLAVADLSVTARRSAVVSFTEPFMTQGIGVLFQSPRPSAPHLFGLLKAYSPVAWVSMIIALIVTSQLLRILGRLSPYEWTNAHECTGAASDECENNFNYRNSLWFCAITFMLQGCDINPRAPSTRLLAASWWVFALVLWISYVANLAAFLTVDTMSTPIRSVDDLVKQTTIRYGTIRNGSQEEFFRASKIPTFRQMWNVMESTTPSVFATSDEEGRARVAAGGYAYLTDTSRIRYWVSKNCSFAQVGSPINVDYFAIALPKGSQLVETLSRGILAMKTKSLPQFEDKWWKASGAKCSEQGSSESSSGGPQPLTAKVVGGIYVLGLIGLLVAFFVAIIEFVWQARKNVREHGAGCIDRQDELHAMQRWKRQARRAAE